MPLTFHNLPQKLESEFEYLCDVDPKKVANVAKLGNV